MNTALTEAASNTNAAPAGRAEGLDCRTSRQSRLQGSSCRPGRLVCAFLAMLLLAQTGLSQLKLGPSITFMELPGPALDASNRAMKLTANAEFSEGTPDAAPPLSFLSSVGGVAFAGIAEPRDAEMRVLDVTYDPEREDGERFRVILGAQGERTEVHYPVADWILIPTIRFAASECCACFTLFGELTEGQLKDRDKRELKRLAVDASVHKINYHSAFIDSLLGVRLMQSDLLLIDASAADLPKVDGKYLLGLGESPVDVSANRAVHRKISAQRRRYADDPFASYLICDYGQRVQFGHDGKTLVMTGYPFWYCWKYRSKDKDGRATLQRAANLVANDEANVELRRLLTAMGRAPDRKATEKIYEPIFEKHSDAWRTRIVIRAMPDYSRKLSALIQREGGINPQVYSALCQTMRLSAFLRLAKQQSPDALGKLHRSVGKLKPAPAVVTPTVMIRKGRR